MVLYEFVHDKFLATVTDSKCKCCMLAVGVLERMFRANWHKPYNVQNLKI